MVSKKTGTKTIHVNDLLRIFMYSERFGATDPDAPRGLERRMMHLTANKAWSPTPRFDCPSPIHQRSGFGHPTHGLYGRQFPLLQDSDFCSRMANFLEKHAANFHYSVIDRRATGLLASGYVGRLPLNHEVSTANCNVAASGASTLRFRQMLAPKGLFSMRKQCDPGYAPPRGQVINVPPNRPDRSLFPAGGKENNGQDFGFAGKIQIDGPLSSVGMMRLDENIPATHPLSATVAPILHNLMHGNPADRGITLNRSGAAA